MPRSEHSGRRSATVLRLRAGIGNQWRRGSASSWAGSRPFPRRSSSGATRSRASRRSSRRSAARRSGSQAPYRVLVDRISQEVKHYRFYLKAAALAGTFVINDPVLVERRRQVLRLLARRAPRRRRAAHRDAPAEGLHPGDRQAPQPPQPRVPARLGGDRRLREVPRRAQAGRRRRVARRTHRHEPRTELLPRLRRLGPAT